MMPRTPPRDKIMSNLQKLSERLECATEHVLTKNSREIAVPVHNSDSLSLQQCPGPSKVTVSKSIKNESVISSKRSTSSQARRKQLELEAAQAKAKIEMDLIDKRLEVNLALIGEDDDNRSDSRSQFTKNSDTKRSQVEEWLDRSSMHPPGQEPEAPAMATEAAPATRCVEPRRATPSTQPVDGMLQLAHTLKDLMTTSSRQHEERLLTRLSTPRDLPIFSGDCIEWLHFKSAYEETARMCQFTESENMWRLRRALKGEAKEAVTDLLIGNTLPSQILDTLELRFGRPDIIIHHLLHQIKRLTPLPNNYQLDIFNFSIKVTNCVATLRATNQNDYLCSPELLSSITSKLPSTLIGKWTDYVYQNLDGKVTKLELLMSFLKREADMISIVGMTQPQPKENKKEHVNYIRKQTADPRYNTYKPVLTSISDGNANECIYCNKSSHALSTCRLFKRAMRKERWRFVKMNKLCFCCLSKHDRNDCPAPPCDINNCGRAHHHLLHYNKPQPSHTTSHVTSDEQEPSCTATAATDAPDRSRVGTAPLVDGAAQTAARASGSAAPQPAPTAPTVEPAQPPAPAGAHAAAAQARATVAHVSGPLPPAPLAPPAPHEGAAPHVLLKVVKVNVSGPLGTVSTFALLDDGAAISMIDKTLVKELGLKCFQPSAIKFIDAFGLEIFQSDAPKICTKISGIHNESKTYDVTLRQVDKLQLPKQNLSVINNMSCDHFSHLKRFVCKECVVPRLLIGEDNYFLMAPLEVLHGNEREPYATKCRLGWTIHGCVGRSHTPAHAHTFHLAHSEPEPQASANDELIQLIKQSYELDCIGISTVRRENTAHLRAVRILDESSRNISDHWEVGLPFTKDDFSMPDSFNYALSRLKGLMRKFQSDESYAVKYRKEIQKLFDLGYARELMTNELSASHIWYLSHFGVQNSNKPGKLRLVFDGAGKVNGVCLNDYLLTGPDLYNSLLGIMLRFRQHNFVIVGDIKDMFLKIKIRVEDQHVLRFLWQDNVNAPLKICVMQSLIFGATCSPFIAQYIKNKNALKYQDLYPDAVDVIINNHYMDDCIHSCDSESQAIQLVHDITYIHSKGGFEIARWSSNSKQVLRTIPSESLAQTAIDFSHGATNVTERTLGLMWYPNDDSFAFKLSLDRIPSDVLDGTQAPTKSQMLSVIMSVYDLHGFLSPFIIKGKILFQSVHRSGVEWNCRIHSDEHAKWMDWLKELQLLCSLRIPRCYLSTADWTPCYAGVCEQHSSNFVSDSDIIEKQMHIFCDASMKAYAAVIYWRFTLLDGRVLVCFAASKSRVSPLRPISIPRLELQGALLGARLADTVCREHKNTQVVKRFYWTDSSTVLQWLRSDPRNYKPYVAHRLGEIDILTQVCEWRHVPSGTNIADVATRENAPPLTYSDVWFQGPSFLRRPECEWPKDTKFSKRSEDVTCEERSVLTVVEHSDLSLPNEDNVSKWIILVRATARVLLFIRKCRRQSVQLDVPLMKEAELLIIKKCQQLTFKAELTCLQQSKPLPSNSRLLQLSPYCDESGVLRVSGRIDKVIGVEQSVRRPAILDGRHRITRLLIEHYHRRALHGANELVVNELRQRYWVLQLRPSVRSVSAHCLFCRYRRAVAKPQRMADLPAARLEHYRRPFSFTGIDFFGPLEVTIGRRREKRYGMLFTCLTIRAIHIELTENLSADSTIMGLRRMGARRGFPSVIYSDNGTNLRGADNELKRSLAEINTNLLREDGTVRGIEWRFIPPGAPEMGGSWERMIRTVKVSLKVVLKERAPHPDTLVTLLAEVEAIVNSRPITHVSTDPNYPEALTPNHFLIGSSSNNPSFGKYDDQDLCLRKRWRVAQRLADSFWARWTREYLPTLIPRQKWTQENRSLQVGDYVILIEPNLERNNWRHGVVTAAHAGSDGRVRIVDVRTRTGILRRPVTRVALLNPAE